MLVCAWEALAAQRGCAPSQLPVSFQRVTLHQAVPVQPKGNVTLSVALNATDGFQVRLCRALAGCAGGSRRAFCPGPTPGLAPLPDLLRAGQACCFSVGGASCGRWTSLVWHILPWVAFTCWMRRVQTEFVPPSDQP